MKICWDNLENLELSKSGNFIKNNSHTYVYKDTCIRCGEPYLMNKHLPTDLCSKSCAMKYRDIGKKFSETHKTRLSMSQRRRFSKPWRHPRWKGGVSFLEIPLFDTYSYQLLIAEKTRRDPDSYGVLQIKCTYCGRWFRPTINEVRARVVALNIDRNSRTFGEGRFYCSINCKKACPMFGQHKYMKGFKHTTSREIQPELRQLVFKRDEFTCQKCGKTNTEIHCHHIDPVSQNPIESADLDNCLTLCKQCHRNVHKIPDCNFNELRCKEGL